MSAICRRGLTGLAVLWPVASWAHALSPTYYPLGPVPFLLFREWWPGLLLIPIAIASMWCVLQRGLPAAGWRGNLWRAVVLYLVGRGGELAAVVLAQSTRHFRTAGMSSAAAENLIPLVVFLACGLATALPVSWWVYRRLEPRKGRVFGATSLAALTSYGVALGSVLLLVRLRGY